MFATVAIFVATAGADNCPPLDKDTTVDVGYGPCARIVNDWIGRRSWQYQGRHSRRSYCRRVGGVRDPRRRPNQAAVATTATSADASRREQP